MGLPYEVGDIVTLKKVHPCGSRDWEILRVGADFRLKCTGCGHQIMVPRKMVEKNTKKLIKKEKKKEKNGGRHEISVCTFIYSINWFDCIRCVSDVL